MVVCHCEAVSDGAVSEAIADGARTVDDVTDRCRAGGGCQGCHRLLQQLLDEALDRTTDERTLTAVA